MAKKAKVLTEEGAQKVLNVINAFENSNEAQHDRTRTADVLTSILDNHMFSRDELAEKGVKTPVIKAAYLGAATGIDSALRTSIFNTAKAVAENVLAKKDNPPALTT